MEDTTGGALRNPPRQGHLENWATGSKVFRDYLAYAHYKAEGKAPSNATLDDKRRMLEGMARFEGETHPVFSRVASIGRTLYLDLGDDAWQSVAITSEGWQVVSHSPARFRRSPAMQALPRPERHPDGITLLREFLNVGSEDDFRMLVAWLLGSFHPKGPYPILILSGEQGSAKSTTRPNPAGSDRPGAAQHPQHAKFRTGFGDCRDAQPRLKL